MDINKLYELWRGNPLDPLLDFSSLETFFQCTLPDDYKQIHRAFGVGQFGEACLFHPNRTSAVVKLPDFTITLRDIMISAGEQQGDSKMARLGASTLVLGDVYTRVYFLWDFTDKKWLIWDSEYNRETAVEEGLIDFLYNGFDYVRHGRLWAGKYKICKSIWAPDDPFFSPALPGRY